MSIATEIRLRIKAEGEAVLNGLGDEKSRGNNWPQHNVAEAILRFLARACGSC